MISLGMIGAGRWAQRYASTLCAQFPDVRISCVARRSPDRPAFLPTGAELFSDWQEMVEKAQFDGLVVCAHPSMHADVVHAALARGVPVMAEKPLSLSLTQIVSLTAVQPKAPVLVNHVHLFSPAFRLLKDCLRGHVREVHSEGMNDGPYRDYSSLFDYGPHDVSMILDVMESLPVSVKCSRLDAPGPGSTYDLRLAFAGVCEPASRSTFGNASVGRVRRFKVVEGLHTYVYDDALNDKLTFDGSPLDVSPESPLAGALACFLGAIDGRPDSRLGLDMALKVGIVLDECSRQCPS